MSKYKRIAVYPSCLYAADFITESIASISEHVDRIFVVCMQRPWGVTSGVHYKGERILWPERFDDTRERVAAIGDPRVKVVEAQKDTPWDRWSYGVNDIVRRREGVDAEEVVIIDPDCVFHPNQASLVFTDWAAHPQYIWGQVNQVELWRTPAWQVTRPRAMVSLHRGDLDLLSGDYRKAKSLRAPTSHPLAGRVHNFGFCTSPENTRWKFLTALAFSPVVGESLPNPEWLDKKWTSWHPTTNNRDLEVSLGCEGAIAAAWPYDVAQLPPSVKKRYDAGEWPKYDWEGARR